MRSRPLVALLLVVLLLAGLAPAVSAQDALVATDLTLDLPAVEGNQHQVPLAPGTTTPFNLTITYSWEAGGYSLDPTEIVVETSGQDNWLQPSLNETPPYYVQPPTAPGTSGSRTVNLTLNLTVTEDAPSFVTTFLFLGGTAKQNSERGNLQPSSHNPDPKFTSGALPQVRVTPSQKLVQLRGGETLAVPVEVSNTGNVPVSAALATREVPDDLGVSLASEVRVPLDGTRVANMTVSSSEMLSSMRGEFLIEARPRWTEDAEETGPTTRTNVVVDVRDLPSAVLFGQQNIAEVMAFTGILVFASFAAGWPLTAWWERRRKAAGRAPFGSGSSGSRSRGGDGGDGSDGDDGDGETVHGVPREGDDYEIVTSDRDVFSERKVHGVPKEGPDYEVVDEDDLFGS